MRKFIHNAIAFTSIALSWIMVVTMIMVVGYLMFYVTYITLELSDCLFIIYALFGCITIAVQTNACIKAFKDSKLWYNDHIKE